jgi:hypothetical protein
MAEDRNDALEALYAERFESLERLHQVGSTLALNEALQCSVDWEVHPPRWVVKAAADRFAAYARGAPLKVGRAAGGLARDRMDMIHFGRWDYVDDLKRVREKWNRELELLREVPEWVQSARNMARVERGVRRFGTTLEDLFYCASELLAGTPLGGSPDTIKSSCRRIERDFKDPIRRYRYHVFDYQTLKPVGLEGIIYDTVSVKKFEAFLNSNF